MNPHAGAAPPAKSGGSVAAAGGRPVRADCSAAAVPAWPVAEEDATHHQPRHGHAQRGWGLISVSFSALGVIYGDIGTSPLYAYQAVFSSPPPPGDVLAAASLFFWTITLVVLLKYIGVVLRFDDNGEGGTFALYSLVCRAAGFGPYGISQPIDVAVKGGTGALRSQLPSEPASGGWWRLRTPHVGSRLRRFYQRSQGAQLALLVVVVVATAMVIGDGVLTPSISVLSAISGLQVAVPSLSMQAVVGVTVAVLVVLFSVQCLGTAKISLAFAPVIAAWLLFNAALGIYNLANCGWGVWQAVSPHHALAAFAAPTGSFEAGWRLLTGVLLSVTGAEAMYADLGHFSSRAVMVSFCAFVYPCLVVTYMGQASYVAAHPEAFANPFWMSVPRGAFWPMLVVATAASVVASQALISGVYSIIRQAIMLGLLPRMVVHHTAAESEGQIYIPLVNSLLLLGCVAMVAGFQDSTALGHAYGVAVITVMFITSWLCALVMVVARDFNPVVVGLFLVVFVPLEGLFLSSNAVKIPEGGWVTLVIAVAVAAVMLVWWYGTRLKMQHLARMGGDSGSGALQWLLLDEYCSASACSGEAGTPALSAETSAQGPLSSFSLPMGSGRGAGGATQPGSGSSSSAADLDAARLWSASVPQPAGRPAPRHPPAPRPGVHVFSDTPLARLPGLGIVYTTAASGLPVVLRHLLATVPALWEVTVLFSCRFIPLPWVAEEARFLARRSRHMPGVYRVVARYGYFESVDHGAESGFVRQLVSALVRACVAGDGAAHAAGGGSVHAAPGGSEGEGSGRGMAMSAASGTGGAAPSRVASGSHGAVPSGATAIDIVGGGLEQWHSVPLSDADEDVMLRVPQGGGDVDMATMSHSLTMLQVPEQLGRPALLGRDSVNRWQCQQLRKRSFQGRCVGGGGGSSAAAEALGEQRQRPQRPCGLTTAQLEEVAHLLRCYQQRAVYVVGGTRSGARPRSGLLRRVALGLYRVLETNSQPATRSWNLPEERLLEVTLNLRL